MKNFNPKYSILTFIFSVIFSVQNLIAKNEPPTPRGSGGFDDEWVVDGPIDNYILLLFFAALIFGAWAINKYKTLDKVKL